MYLVTWRHGCGKLGSLRETQNQNLLKGRGIFNLVKKKQLQSFMIWLTAVLQNFNHRLLGIDEENPSGIQGANGRNEGLSPFGNRQCLIKMHGPLFRNLFAVAQRQTHYWRLAFNVKHWMKGFPRGLSMDIKRRVTVRSFMMVLLAFTSFKWGGSFVWHFLIMTHTAWTNV